VPTQQRRRRDQEDRPPLARQQLRQCREHQPVAGHVARSGDLAAQHHQLMPQHGDLHIFGIRRWTTTDQPQHPPDDHERHRADSQPAAPHRRWSASVTLTWHPSAGGGSGAGLAGSTAAARRARPGPAARREGCRDRSTAPPADGPAPTGGPAANATATLPSPGAEPATTGRELLGYQTGPKGGSTRRPRHQTISRGRANRDPNPEVAPHTFQMLIRSVAREADRYEY